jgi:hypothetical protein
MKDIILNTYTQEHLFALYLGIKESDIMWCLSNSKNKIKNAHRFDQRASLSFTDYNGKIVAKDYADIRYRGDIFEIVGNILGLNSNNKEQFYRICLHILDTANNSKHRDVMKEYRDESKEFEGVDLTTITVIPKEPKRNNYDWYARQGIDRNIFNKYITVVNSYIINDRISAYRYRDTDPCYSYTVNPGLVKLYFPKRKNTGLPRFITNNKLAIENINTIEQRRVTILAKAQKDKLFLDKLILELRLNKIIQVLSVASESAVLSKQVTNVLENYSYTIYTMFDNDNAGLAAMQSYEEKYNYKPMIIGDYTTLKDITDYCKAKGYIETIKMFNNKLKEYGIV